MSFIDGLRHRITTLIRGDHYTREQQEELRVHIELEAMQQSHAGAAPLEAAAAARRRVGNLTFIKEELRRAAGFVVIDRLRQDLAYALRGLKRSPGFTVTVVLTLALGLGANAAIFSFLDRVFARAPGGVTAPGRVRRLYVKSHDLNDNAKTMVFPFFDYQAFEAVRDAAGHDAEVAAFTSPSTITIGTGDASVRTTASWITPNYLSLLGVRLEHGRLFAADEARIDVPAPVAILSYALWKTAFALDPQILGKDVAINKRHFTIIGVTDRGFSGIDVDAAGIFLPMSTFPVEARAQIPWYRSYGNYLRVVARPAPASAETAVLARGGLAYNRQPPIAGSRFDTTSALLAGPVVEARGPAVRGQEIQIGTRIAGVALAVLLIACANVANLLLVRAANRRREIAVRLALGVSRSRLCGQMLTESLLLASIAGIVGIAVAWWGGTALRRALLPNVHWAGGAVDIRILAFMAVTTFLAGVSAGFAPVLLARGQNVVEAMKGGARAGVYRRSRLRSALLIAQTALAIVLVVGAGLSARSLGNVSAIRVGYDVDSLMFATVSFDEAFYAPGTQLQNAITDLAARLKSEPGVLATAYSSSAPMRGWTSFGIALPGRDSLPKISGRYPLPQMNWVSSNFFRAVGTRIVAGRSFAQNEPAAAIIVNETMAQTFWPGENAVGKCMYLSHDRKGACAPVVGVSANAHLVSIIEGASMQYFLPNGLAKVLIIRVDPAHWATVAVRARAELKRLLPHSESVSVTPMRLYLDRELSAWRLGASLFAVFGLFALLVAAIGVYSVIAYAVSQRTREMGVRVALGARIHDLVQLIVGEGFRMIAVGIILGIGIAFALGKLVASLLYGVTAQDPLVMVSATLILAGVGIVACFIPAWRAAGVDPVTALRAD